MKRFIIKGETYLVGGAGPAYIPHGGCGGVKKCYVVEEVPDETVCSKRGKVKGGKSNAGGN